MEEELKNTYCSKKTKKLERGISFPTCLSINEVAGNFSPLADESTALKAGDLVKIELGCHIDGYLANAAHTIVVGGKSEGRQADVIQAAYNSFQAAIRSFKVGGLNQDVTQNIASICEAYEVQPVQGVLSHRVKKHLCDGNEVIINRETPEQRVEDYEFQAGDIFHLDVMVSSSEEGIPREIDCRTTVYHREMDQMYNLKSKSARAFFSIVNQKYPTFPFSIRGFEDVTGARVGVKECVNHELMIGFPVLAEKEGEFIARFSATIAVQAKTISVLCGGRDLANAEGIKSEKTLNDDLKQLVSRDLWVKEKKAKK